MIITNEESLRRDMLMSLEYCDKFGRHHNNVGYHFINIADIVLKKANITMPEYLLLDIKQETICELIRMLNRMDADYITRIQNTFNYMYQVAVKAVFTQVKEMRNADKAIKELIEFLNKEKLTFLMQE